MEAPCALLPGDQKLRHQRRRQHSKEVQGVSRRAQGCLVIRNLDMDD